MERNELSGEEFSRRAFLEGAGVTAAGLAALYISYVASKGRSITRGFEVRSGSIDPNVDSNLIEKFATTFAPENVWQDARLTYGPVIAKEVAFLPSLDSELTRNVSLDIIWSNEALLKDRKTRYPAANKLTNIQKPHLPRSVPVLNSKAFSPISPLNLERDYPYLPKSVTIGKSFRKGEVLRLATREEIITPEVQAELDIGWIALSKIGRRNRPKELSYQVESRIPSYSIPVRFRVENGTMFLVSDLQIRSEIDNRPPAYPPFLPPNQGVENA